MRIAFRSLFLLAGMVLYLTAPAQNCLAGWRYRVPVTVSNAGNPALTNYQVKITLNTSALVAAGKMRPDGGDIRFTTGDCCTPVCHWIESGMSTTNTVIWLKIPSLPAGGTQIIYLHYGNANAVGNENGDCVFEFFDDFNDGVIDPAKWTIRGTPSLANESNGTLNFSGNGNWEYIRSNTSFSTRVRIKDSRNHSVVLPATTSAGFVMGYTGTDNRYTFRYNSSTSLMQTTSDADLIAGNSVFDGNYPGINYCTTLNTYEAIAEILATTIFISQTCNTTVSSCNNTAKSLNAFTGSGFYVGYSTFNNTTTMVSDYILVRKFTATDPACSVGTEYAIPNRVLALRSDTAVCMNELLTIDAGSGFDAYVWHNSSAASAINIAFPPEDTVWCQVQDAQGCIFTDTLVVSTIQPVVTISTPPGSGVCLGDTATLTATGGATYSWNTGDTIAAIQIAPSSPAMYTVIAADSNGCMDTATVNLAVWPLPNMLLSAPPAACPGDTVLLTVSGASAYLWNTGDLADSIRVIFPGTGLYSVTGTDTNGCSNTDTANVIAFSLPSISISGPNMVCAGDTITLTAGGASTYAWSTLENTAGIDVHPAVNTTYSVTGTDANGCKATASQSVTVNSLPVVSYTEIQNSACTSWAPFTLTAGSPAGGSYRGTGVYSGTMFAPGLTGVGTFPVVYQYIDANNCSNTDTSLITVNACLGMEEEQQELFSAYPNPTSGIFNLVFSGTDPGETMVKIINASGAVVYTTSVYAVQTQIDMTPFARGMYWIILQRGMYQQKLKLVRN